jgi:TniQ
MGAKLPFVPQPFAGEMLSSWLRRTAAEYAVSLEHLTRHLDLSVSRPMEIDHFSTRDDIERTAAALSVTAAEIRDMIHSPLKMPFIRLREMYLPVQVCTRCRADHARSTAEPVAIKAWFEYWQIECQQCMLPFSPPGGTNIYRCNPAREEPEWFGRILPFARKGAAQVKRFVIKPHRALVSPLAILHLLSMRIGPPVLAAPRPPLPSRSKSLGHHYIAELFLPGLRERLNEHRLLETPWTERRPVRLVTARTILYAALANFMANPRAAYRRTVDALVRPRRQAVEQWLDQLPEYSTRVLSP